MIKYKGYDIDNVVFNTEKEIDEFVRAQAIEAYKTAVKVFCINSTMEASTNCNEKAEILVNQFGFTWEQVEELEIEVMKSVA